jgi:hypothetical protein
MLTADGFSRTSGDWGGMDGSLHLGIGKMIYRWWFCHIEGLVYPTIFLTSLVNVNSLLWKITIHNR